MYSQNYIENQLDTPLAVFHQIKYTSSMLNEIIYALSVIGLPVAKEIANVAEELDRLSELGSDLYMQEINDRCQMSQENLDATLATVLKFTLEGKK